MFARNTAGGGNSMNKEDRVIELLEECSKDLKKIRKCFENMKVELNI